MEEHVLAYPSSHVPFDADGVRAVEVSTVEKRERRSGLGIVTQERVRHARDRHARRERPGRLVEPCAPALEAYGRGRK